jgi:hypothetical protein
MNHRFTFLLNLVYVILALLQTVDKKIGEDLRRPIVVVEICVHLVLGTKTGSRYRLHFFLLIERNAVSHDLRMRTHFKRKVS